MMTADSETRSRYLALALDARRVMDVLVPFVDRGQRGEALDSSVKDAIRALSSLEEAADINAVHPTLAFGEYEQVLTVDEIKKENERKAIIQDLETILKQDAADKRDAAVRVLQFLFAVESRALHYYTRSPVASAYAR